MSLAGRKGSTGAPEISKRRSGSIVSKEPNTRFLNVDLDVKSMSDLRPLLEAWGHEVSLLHSGRIGRRYWIRVELSRRHPKNPVDALRGFSRLVRELPPLPKKLWNGAYVREFDIGIQGGEKVSGEWILDAATLREVAKVGAQIELTIYSSTMRTHRDPAGS